MFTKEVRGTSPTQEEVGWWYIHSQTRHPAFESFRPTSTIDEGIQNFLVHGEPRIGIAI
jgi:hypothetical protein